MSPVVVGRSVPRLDGVEKVTGSAVFTADLDMPRMLIAKVLRSPVPHARIRRIDTSKAARLAGVHAIVTGPDYPYRYNIALRDQPFLAIDKVRYVGEPVVAVAAVDRDTAEDAIALIAVEYEELPALFDPTSSCAVATSSAPSARPTRSSRAATTAIRSSTARWSRTRRSRSSTPPAASPCGRPISRRGSRPAT